MKQVKLSGTRGGSIWKNKLMFLKQTARTKISET